MIYYFPRAKQLELELQEVAATNHLVIEGWPWRWEKSHKKCILSGDCSRQFKEWKESGQDGPHRRLSEVAALGLTSCQFIPQADHLPGRLVMCSEVVHHATILTESPTVRVLNWGCSVELFDPHAHAYIFHLEHLQECRSVSVTECAEVCRGGLILHGAHP